MEDGKHAPSDGREIPMAVDAEKALLGAMLLNERSVQAGLATVEAQDFIHPKHASVFSAIRHLHSNGNSVDPTTVSDELRRRSEPQPVGDLISLQAATPSTSSAPRYAAIIVDHAIMRRLIQTGGAITELGYSRPSEMGEALDEAQALLMEVARGLPGPIEGLVESLDDICAEAEEERDWVILDLLSRSDRMIVVAHPGSGKTMLFRQIAVMCAQGIHPFKFSPIPKVRSLLVDFENPRGIIRRMCRPILSQAQRSARPYEDGLAGLYHRPGGINIRKRSDFSELDAALSEFQPDLVCLGPLYKTYRSEKGESYEDVASDVTGRLDDLRTRHGFALLIEHHAGKNREMVPQGSAVWERWPEFGVGLEPVTKGDPRLLAWSEWRGAREVRDWPSHLERGQVWPWEARFGGSHEPF